MILFENISFHLDSNNSMEEVIQNLKDKTGRTRFLMEPETENLFIGKVMPDWFRLQPYDDFENSRIWMMKGRVTPKSFGCHILLKLYVKPFIEFFIILWYLMLALSTYLISVAATDNPSLFLLLPVLLVLFIGSGSVFISVKKDRDKSLKLLLSILCPKEK